MLDYKTLNGDGIIEWCVANGQTDWLKENIDKYNSFLTLKKAFALKFMPNIIPKAKAKPISFKEKVDKL